MYSWMSSFKQKKGSNNFVVMAVWNSIIRKGQMGKIVVAVVVLDQVLEKREERDVEFC